MEPTQRKLRGGYYTPAPIPKFLAAWAIPRGDARVLEPCCGDGALVEAARECLSDTGEITAVELFAEEALKTVERSGAQTSVHVGDAFSWFRNSKCDSQFDAVIGNPPFIRYQTFPEPHRDAAFQTMREEDLHPSRLTNAWVPFVVLATRCLRQGGRLALVLPAELLQVTYASELREYLVRNYSHLTVVTFRRLLFAGTQQETILLLGTRKTNSAAKISWVELDSAEDLSLRAVNKVGKVEADLDHAREKWTQFYLSPAELGLIREIESSNAFTTLGELAEVDVGIVTGRNEFFVLTHLEAEALGVQKWCRPLVGRSAQIPGLVLTPEDWRNLLLAESKCLLLQLGDCDRNGLAPKALAYVRSGE
ncbi:MAG TPA: N-6 DNA methylase, partial [Actinomycetota bacterium]|nr:N-6 DNA methylase [Actinomycetota bacterium]